MSAETIFPPLTDHPFPGPFLTVNWDAMRCHALRRQVVQLQVELGSDHPQVALAASWYAVSHGAESFSEELLHTLRESEPVIREQYPQAHRALAMNLAAQGCHTWSLHSKQEAIGPLASAFHLMMTHDVAVEADIVKVAEVLADCYAACGDFDEALVILYSAQPFILGALEQREYTVAQYEQFREEFIQEHGGRLWPAYADMLEVLRWPQIRAAFPNYPRGQVNL